MLGRNKIFKQTFEEWLQERCYRFGDNPEKILENIDKSILVSKYELEKNKAVENEKSRREKISRKEIPEDEKIKRTEGVRRYYSNLSEDEREKIRQRAIETGNRPEVKEKLRKQRNYSEGTRDKMRVKFEGKNLSEEHVAKLREGQKRRHERDGKVKRKPYVARCEKCKEKNRRSCSCKRIITEETREKMRGRKISDESREKIRKSLKAQKFIHSCGKITSVAGNASQHSKKCGCTYKPLNESNT